MIVVVLTCTEKDCGARSEEIPVDSIDTYAYHDAPYDGLTFCDPTNWYSDIESRIALCPDHRDNVKKHQDAYYAEIERRNEQARIEQRRAMRGW